MLKSVGQGINRIDGPAKVTGTAKYAADMHLPGQLYALSVRSVIAAGQITCINDVAARRVEGVVAVYTHLNAPSDLKWHASAERLAMSADGLGLSALGDGAGGRTHGLLPLCTSEIVYAGQWIAVVVAESIEAAQQATALVEVNYELATATMTLDGPEDAFLTPGFFFGEEMQVVRGPAFDRVISHTSLDKTYATPTQHHQPMEPTATLAHWVDGEVTLHDSTQGVIATRDYVAHSLGIEPCKVRVLSPYVGGGFGAKNQIWPHQAFVAHLARALNRPVRLQLSRADMSVASGHRGSTLQQMSLAASSEGALEGIRHVSRTPTSMHGGFFEPCGLNTLLLYPANSLEVRHRVRRCHIPTPTPFRGPGETPGSFALESALDELAHALQMDPLELRRRNYAERDTLHGRAWSSNHLLDCYTMGAEAFGWPGTHVPPRSRREGFELIGYGMATTAYPAPALPATVRVRLHSDGLATVETAATDIGTGMYTVLAQVVADALCVPVSHVVARLGDSLLPPAPTAGRSKSTASVIPAAFNACSALREKIRLLGRRAGHVLRDGETCVGILAAISLPSVEAEASSAGKPTGEDFTFYSFGAHFVEVRVDETLGRIRVARVTSAFDCGRILNPKTAASQIKGGIVFGIGMALMEKTEFDPKEGRIVNDNLADYHVPVNADVPDIDVLFADQADQRFNELGVRGLGEIAVPGTAAAIANAVFNATGRRVRSLPITARDIL